MTEVGRGRLRWLRENVSFLNTLLLVAGIFIAVGRNYGANEESVRRVDSNLAKIESKVDVTIKQNVDNGVALTLVQRDVKDASDDIAEMRKEIADMKAAQAELARQQSDLNTRVGVIENRQNKR